MVEFGFGNEAIFTGTFIHTCLIGACDCGGEDCFNHPDEVAAVDILYIQEITVDPVAFEESVNPTTRVVSEQEIQIIEL